MEGGRKSVNGGYDPSGRKSRIPAAYPVTMVKLKLICFNCYFVSKCIFYIVRYLSNRNVLTTYFCM